jgi:hypothetical protein
MKIFFFVFLIFFYLKGYSQKKLEISGGMDLYYAINPIDNKEDQIPIFVSSNQLNSSAINLGLIEFKYKLNKQWKFQLSPGFGTYMSANYSGEKKYLRWIYEAFISFSPRKNSTEWLEFGVFSSPYTTETPKSWDHPIYTRSLAPELVPYFISGFRYQNQLFQNLKFSLFILNGWQRIGYKKELPSLGTQFEYKTEKNAFNWTTYSGNEYSSINPKFGFRFFSELSWTYENEKIKTSSCIYSGWQYTTNKSVKNWWQLNGLIDFKISKKTDLVVRQEYFHDPNKIHIQTPLNTIGYRGFVSSIGYFYRPSPNLFLRLEAKSLFGKKETELFLRNGQPTNWLPLLFGNITIIF